MVCTAWNSLRGRRSKGKGKGTDATQAKLEMKECFRTRNLRGLSETRFIVLSIPLIKDCYFPARPWKNQPVDERSPCNVIISSPMFEKGRFLRRQRNRIEIIFRDTDSPVKCEPCIARCSAHIICSIGLAAKSFVCSCSSAHFTRSTKAHDARLEERFVTASIQCTTINCLLFIPCSQVWNKPGGGGRTPIHYL